MQNMHHMSKFSSDGGDSDGGSGGSKRPFENVKGDEKQGVSPGDKRRRLPGLASVVVEAVKRESLQKLSSSLEPILRKVVVEEVDRALARLAPRLGARTPPRQIQESPASDLRLSLTNKLCLPLFTGGKVEAEGGLPVQIVLTDETTRQIVDSGPLSSVKLEVVVLDGDFANEDDDDWTADDFEKYVVKERDGKRPLLTGDLNVALKEGVCVLGELTFTDNSSWIRSRKFRLGVRVAPGFCEDIRVKECKTEAFAVKDHRGELYKKHYPPHLHDDVWRLDKIAKDGAYHKKLLQGNIKTVEDFLRCYMMDRPKLTNILGGMSCRMRDATIEHAKTCVLSGNLYVYYGDSSQGIGVIFNHIYELLGVTVQNEYKSVESLSENTKVYVDRLVKAAYENWSSVIEYHNEILPNETAQQSMGLSQQPGQFQTIFTPTSDLPADNVAPPQLYGYVPEHTSRFSAQGNGIIQSNQVFNAGVDPHGQPSPTISGQASLLASNIGPANTGLALGSSQPLLSRAFGDYTNPMPQQVFQSASTEWQPYPAPNPIYFTEEDIREEDIRAQALTFISQEDIQQLLRAQYLSQPENIQLQGDVAYFSAGLIPSPAVNYADDGTRTTGKACVGWLKLKAALRWGIFIRKIAAKKVIQRAQLEEIDD